MHSSWPLLDFNETLSLKIFEITKLNLKLREAETVLLIYQSKYKGIQKSQYAELFAK